MNAHAKQVVAAFDVDGTLTKGESLLHFLRAALGTWPLASRVGITLARLGTGRAHRSRDSAKRELLARTLAGRACVPIERAGVLFANHLATHRLLPDAASALSRHQSAGHATVLVSASPGIYIHAFGRLLGVDAVLCTELEVSHDDHFTGSLLGANMRGLTKVRALNEWLDSRSMPLCHTTLYAYGDSSGDNELLALAGQYAHDRRRERRFAPEMFEPATPAQPTGATLKHLGKPLA